MRDSLLFTLLFTPFTSISVLLYTVTRWGNITTYYALAFIDAIILAGPILARRRRDRIILHYSSEMPADNSLQIRADLLARKMGVDSVRVYLADSQRLRRVNALQIGVGRTIIVVSDILIRGLTPSEQDAISQHPQDPTPETVRTRTLEQARVQCARSRSRPERPHAGSYCPFPAPRYRAG